MIPTQAFHKAKRVKLPCLVNDFLSRVFSFVHSFYSMNHCQPYLQRHSVFATSIQTATAIFCQIKMISLIHSVHDQNALRIEVPRGLFNTVTPGLTELPPDHLNIRELKAVTNEDFFNTVQTERYLLRTQNVARHLCRQQCVLVCHHLKQTTTATQPECHQTKGLMSRRIALHVRFLR